MNKKTINLQTYSKLVGNEYIVNDLMFSQAIKNNPNSDIFIPKGTYSMKHTVKLENSSKVYGQ